jgi:hypothetical protein
MYNVIESARLGSRLVCFLVLTLLLSSSARSATVCTNFDGLHYELVLPSTNLTAGEWIGASMVISNTTETERAVGWGGADVCNTAIGEFLIVELPSQRQIPCLLPPFNRGGSGSHSLGILAGHEGRSFHSYLVEGFGLTNAGIYSIQAVGHFTSSEGPGHWIELITPPLLIKLSPKPDKNPVPQRAAPVPFPTNGAPSR